MLCRLVAMAANVLQTFQELAVQFGWEQEVVNWCVDAGGLAAATINDFIMAATSESDWASIVNLIPNIQNKLQQTSRLRQAWKALRDATDDQDKLKRKRLDDVDLDSLLQQPVLDSLQDQFWVRYHLSLPPYLAPSDSLISRLSKELEKRVLSVRDVFKTKTQEQQIRRQKKRTDLGGKLTLIQEDDDEDIHVHESFHNYLEMLLTLMYAYSIAGGSRLASAPVQELRTTPSYEVVQCPLDIMMRYYYRAAHSVQKVPHTKQLTWLQHRDEAERARWVDQHRNTSMELGAIVHTTFYQRESMWEPPLDDDVSTQKQFGSPQPKTAGKGKGKEASKKAPADASAGSIASHFRDGTKLCAAFQTAKGCPKKECDKHLCAVVLSSGRVCGGRHAAVNHENVSTQKR